MSLKHRAWTWIVSFYRWLFARPSMYGWNRRLGLLSFHGLGLLNHETAADSGEQHLIDTLLPQLLGADPVVFDVGANVGAFTQMILDRFPASTVHAFEPHPESCSAFTVDPANPRVVLHQIGIGASPGSAVLYDRADLGASSHSTLYEGVITDIHGQATTGVEVEIDTLDRVAQREGISKIDFVKIDVEGHEYAVLKGAAGLLASEAIGAIQFEFNEMNVVSRTFLRDFTELLPDHDLYRLLPSGTIRLDDSPLFVELFGYQNILAVPASRSSDL